MSNSESNVQNLGQVGQESISALIQAIAPDIANNSGGNLTSDHVANGLNEKLDELVTGYQGNRNERGEVVNEEGLPIVEITEPVNPTDLRTSTSRPTPVTVEPLIPLVNLSDEARARLHTKRDQILDMLEEEEKQLEIAHKLRQAEENDANTRNRKEITMKEKERLKEARELQKKMGRALLLNVSKAREKELQKEAAQRLRDEEADQDRKRSPTIKKKTVAFAERTEQIDQAEMEQDSDWGDVTPGRLTQKRRPTLASQALLDQHPMKMTVIERLPSGTTSWSVEHRQDSDDDSEPNPPDSSDNEEITLETDEIDFDAAQHQREIALEYHEKRDTIGREAAQTVTHSLHESDVHQETTQDSKPAISHFKANRLASAYNASAPSSLSHTQATSFDTSVLPASSARTIQRSIRTGKLDSDGNLVSGDADSEDEAEGVQEVLDLIQKGDLYNIGPNGEFIHSVVPPLDVASSSRSTTSSSQKDGILPFQASTFPPPSMRSKTSQFKASRTTTGRPPTFISMPDPITPMSSASATPISYETRSSPKLGTPTTPMTPSITERTPPVSAIAMTTRPETTQIHSPQAATGQRPSSSHFSSVIIDSPSFPSGAIPPVVIESPSYPRGPSSRPDQPPTVISSSIGESKRVNQDSFRSNPQAVVSNIVRDLQPVHEQQPRQLGHDGLKRISRFKAERMS